LGMTNTNHTNIEAYQDVYSINYYHQLKAKGEDAQAFLDSHSTISRDNGRTPMQWDLSENAGFTTGTPWLAVNKNYTYINVAEQENNPDSVLNFFRKMIQLRKENPVLVYGAFELIDEINPQLFAYTRKLNDQQMLVVLNFSDQQASLSTNIDVLKRNIITGNYKAPSTNNLYKPYEAVIYEIQF